MSDKPDIPGFYLLNQECFQGCVGIDEFKHVNVFIGKNNSGKSKFVRAIALSEYTSYWHRASLDYSNLEHNEVINLPSAYENVFTNRSTLSQFMRVERFYWAVGRETGRQGYYSACEPEKDVESLTRQDRNTIDRVNSILLTKRRSIAPLENYARMYVGAARKIQPESHSEPSFFKPTGNQNKTKLIPPQNSGKHMTQLIRRLLYSDNESDREFVEITLVDELNVIFSPEIKIVRILALEKDGSNRHEIYLIEENQKQVPLSQAGEGLATVIIVLAYLHIISKKYVDNKPNKCMFVFEELENNLHATIQRRLFNYLLQFAKHERCIMLITTHSHIALDIFAQDDDAQIIEVTQRDRKTKLRQIKANTDVFSVVSDLGYKASDLLQANCLIWVEGPSDRVYLNHLIELTDADLKENVHFQYLFYGGALGSSYHSDPDDDGPNSQDFLSMLRVNRNSFFVVDSDKNAEDSVPAAWKMRICEGLAQRHWITNGREIENYISVDALNRFLSARSPKHQDLTKFNMYERLEDVLKEATKDFGGNKRLTKYDSKKPYFSKQIVGSIQETDLDHLDLRDQLDNLANFIRNANQLQTDEEPDFTPES